MIRLRRDRDTSVEAMVGTIWIGTFLAIILAVPPLGIFLGIYLGTGELLIGAVLGFGAHFVILAFSSRISEILTRVILRP